ncbi:hypothetical protein [Reyranella sp.]|uniref:hypothetical protein n=1 Tax=Reyranella sp. TaxID=1929291 RepID=UPI0011FEF6C6|nr:hypothetical protein [Reyranella sp.]TAJ90421.1 MAG: hypothetical protein EPO50_01410 [Reyranella sp.]
MKMIAAAVAVFVMTAPAWADMPIYDVKKHCDAVAAFGGTPSQSILNGCLNMEQSAYDRLKPVWNTLPTAMQNHCDQVATFGGGGSYSLLSGCVDQEISAAKANENFRFKR